MNKSDQDFENYLREFRPRQPRAMPDAPVENAWQWQRLAAAALLAITCGSSVWFTASRYHQSPTQISSQPTTRNLASPLAARTYSRAELRRLAVEDPAKFDAALFAAAQNSLPRFTEPSSLLRVLAQD
jgi:hypothetical protein